MQNIDEQSCLEMDRKLKCSLTLKCCQMEYFSMAADNFLQHPKYQLDRKSLYCKIATEIQSGDYTPNKIYEYLQDTEEGCALYWTIIQKRQLENYSVPEKLQFPSSTYSSLAEITAKAWALWPENPTIASKEKSALLKWLLNFHRTYKWLLQVFFTLDFVKEIESLSSRWLQTETWNAESLMVIEKFLDHPDAKLRSIGIKAISYFLNFQINNREMFLRGCCLAEKHCCYKELLWALNFSSNRNLLSSKKISELYIYTSIGLGQAESALQHYRDTVLGKKQIFPYVSRLLKIAFEFNDLGVTEDLLQNIHDSDGLPLWIKAEKMYWQKNFKGANFLWKSLWNDEKEIFYLKRWCLCLLGSPQNVRLCYVEDIISICKSLLCSNENVIIAASITVVLKADTQEYSQLTELYERYLKKANFSELWVAKATKEYMYALVWGRYWNKLDQVFGRKDHPWLGIVCSFEEYSFFQLLYQIHYFKPTTKDSWLEWFYKWDRIQEYPMNFQQLSLVTDQFVKLNYEYQVTAVEDQEVQKYYSDLYLRMEYYGRSKAENFLIHSSLPLEKKLDYKNRLQERGLENLSQLLMDLHKEQ